MPRSNNRDRAESRPVTPPQKKPGDASARRLRALAEKKLGSRPHAAGKIADPKTSTLIHELQVHQIELQMQNEELREVQRGLEKSREKFLDLYDFSPVGYLSLNNEGAVIEVNITALTLLTLKRSDLIGKPFYRVIHPEYKDLFYQYWKRLHASAEPMDCELRLKKRDNGYFPAQLLSSSLARDGKPAGEFLFAIFDISTRRRADDVIKRNEASLESLFKVSQYSTDSVPALLDFALSEAIALTESTIGYIYLYDDAKKEFTLNSWSKKVMKECTIIEKQTVYQLEKTGIWGEAVRQAGPIIINDFHARNPLKKGYPEGHAPLHKFATIPVFLDGRIVCVIGVANKKTDYTDEDIRLLTLLMNLVWKMVERKQNEKVLEESRRDLNRAQEVSHTGSWRMDVQKNVLLWSDENHRIFGIPKGTPLTYETFLSTVHPDDKEYVDRKWTAALKGEHYDIEHRIVAAGVTKWVRETAGLEFDGQGKLLGGFGTTQDITEIKKREQELDQLNRTLKALSKSSLEMVRATDESIYLQRICDIIAKDCGYTMVWIGFAENDKDRTIRPVAQAGIEKGFLDTLTLSWADNERGRGPTGTAIRTGKIYQCGDLLADPAFASWRKTAQQRGFVSSISIPLIGDTSAFGAITIFSSDSDAFSDDEVKLLKELTDDLAYGIRTIRLRADQAASEKALRIEHEFINTILQTTGGLIVVLDPQGRIKKFNHACEKATGYSFDEVKDRPFWDILLLPEEVGPVKSVFANLAAGSFPNEFENYWVHRDSTRRYIRWSNSVILDTNGAVDLIVGTGIDITERKQMENELAEKSLLLENLVRKQDREIIDTKENLDLETRERLRVEQELTHRQQALESVYAMATAFDSSFVAMNDQVVLNVAKILDTPFAAIYYFFEERASMGSQFYKGKLIRQKEAAIPCAACRRDIFGGKEPRGGMNVLTHSRHSGCFPLEEVRSYIGVPILNLQGEVHGMICALDSVERSFDEYEVRLVEIFARYLSHEQSRRELESQLLRANEMKMLGQLTSGVAHEVRNPLNGIMAIMGALSKELGDTERFQPYLQHLRNQVTRLTMLMEDLLALGRPVREENKLEMPVVALVEKALSSWQHGLEKPREVRFDRPQTSQPDLMVRAEGARIEQIIINLLENAHQHSPPDQTIVLSIVSPVPSMVLISVRDNGPGIAEEIMPRIFEPFFTTRKSGTGLGLSIVKHIVESHGGAITAHKNMDGSGVTFTINLPLLQMSM
jgi:PAS domain S-box-containing protein